MMTNKIRTGMSLYYRSPDKTRISEVTVHDMNERYLFIEFPEAEQGSEKGYLPIM